jgi:glycosyltransferase involved in cell wall biosynthesis
LTLHEIGGMSKIHPFARWVQMGEDLACRHADLVVSTLPGAFEHLKMRGLTEDRFRWSPQAANPVSPDPVPLPSEHNELLDSLRENGRIIGVMAGGLVPAINLPLLLEAAPMAASAGVDVVIVGSGELEDLARKATGKNVHLLPRIHQAAMPSLLARVDFGISGSQNLNLYRYGVSPNKVTEYMASGLPVVLSVPCAKNLVEDAQAGFVTGAESSEQLASGMIKLAAMSQVERLAMGKKGKQYIEANASISTIARQYLNWIN